MDPACMSDAPLAAAPHRMDEGQAAEAVAAAATSAATVAEARPTAQRARSSGGGRSALAARLTPSAAAAATASARKAAAVAANQARAEAEAARRARHFTADEHSKLLASLWSRGLESHELNGSQGSPRRELRAHADTLAALPSKTPAEVTSYLRLWFWRCILVPFAFASDAMHKAGAPGFRLNAEFVEELRESHSLAPLSGEDGDAPELVSQELSNNIPSSDAAAQPAHIVLSRWVARLRRCMLLTQMGNDASAIAASLQSLRLQYTADLLPEAKWTARDDAALLVGARTRGYESVQPALMQARCDFLCDAFHAHCLDQASKLSEAQDLASARSLLLAASHAPSASAASSTVVPAPACFSTPVWNGALVRKVFAVLTTHGLPTHSFLVAADAKLKLQADAAAAAATGAAVAPAEFVCPVCPLLDWRALYALLSLHTGLQFDARWQRPLSALLCQACLEFETKARRVIGGGLHSNEDMVAESSGAFDLAQSMSDATSDASSLCPSFLSYSALHSFRCSCLFFHQLRVRILDPAFHGFANGDAGVLEWVSQFAPGLSEPAANAAAAATAAAAQTSKAGATLEAVQAEPAADYGRIVDGSASLLCSTPFASASLASAVAAPADSSAAASAASASAASLSSSSSMPSWYQIGFHDLCLLKSVAAWGLELNVDFFERINADLRSHTAATNGGAAADSTMHDASASSSSSSSSSAAPLSNLHWLDSASWLAHSRGIIRHRMGEASAAPVSPGHPVEPLPAVTPIESHNHVALIKRAAQLVQSLAAVATDEVCNRLLQCVQVAPNTNGAAAPATNGVAAAAAAASSSAPTASSVPFSLTAAGAASLSFFQHSLCGYQMQRAIYTLLRTRYYDLAPPAATVAARLASAAAKRHLGLHSSPAAAVAAARALGLSLVAPAAAGVSPEEADTIGECPENPAKLSDAAFLRPTHSMLMPAQIAARFPGRFAAQEAFAATTAAAPAAGAAARVKREQEDEMADDDLAAAGDDAAAAEEQAPRSLFAELLDADRKRSALTARITALMGEDPSAPCAVPWPLFVSADARLVLPQQLGPGFVLHALGSLSPKHVLHSQRLIAARSAAQAMEDAAAVLGPRSHLIVLFPVGYRAVVRHASYKRADKLVLYLCEILAAPTAAADASSLSSSAASSAELQFRVTAEDDPSHPIVAASAQAAWEAVSVAIAQMEAAESAAASSSAFVSGLPAKSKRATAPGAAAAAAAVDGVSRFGLDRSGVLHALAAEVLADPSMQRALADAFTSQQLSAHASALEACQFYSCPSSSSARVAAATDDAAAFSLECSHNLLRLQRLTQSLQSSLSSVPAAVYSASGSSVVALQAAALRDHQLSAAHAAHQHQQHQLAVAHQQAQMRHRMEEEMATAQQAAAQAAAAAYYAPSPYAFVHPQHYMAQQQQAQVAAAAAAAAAAAQGYAQMQ